MKIQSSKDLAAALLKAASDAASGNANAEQCAVLCQCTDAIVKLARLEIEAARYDPHPVPWMDANQPNVTRIDSVPLKELATEPDQAPEPPSTGAGTRIADIEKQIAKAQAEMKSASPTSKLILEDKIQQWQDRIKFLQKTASKISS